MTKRNKKFQEAWDDEWDDYDDDQDRKREKFERRGIQRQRKYKDLTWFEEEDDSL